MSDIKAVVFDLDGVLIDAREWHYEALNQALAMFAFTITRAEHLSTYDGLPTRKKLAKLTTAKGLPEPLHDLISRVKQQCTQSVIADQCRPRFEKEFMLSRLKASGLKLAVASNSVRESVKLMLRRSAILDQFDFFLSNEDVVDPKPDPEIYNLAAAKLGLSPHEVVVVEDNHYGIQAARASGCHVIEVEGVDDVSIELMTAFLTSMGRSL